MGIIKSTKQYEQWLAKQTPLIQADLDRKHEAMASAPFPFFRATFYRWVQQLAKTCSDLTAAPAVLAVGDLHVENFGTWRDAEGRMVWGINDFDEAYPLAYTNDMVRLATSALLAARDEHLSVTPAESCDAILAGYCEALEAGGRPIVLDEEHRWLAVLVKDEARDPVRFWQKMRELPDSVGRTPGAALRAIRSMMPETDSPLRIAHRVAGLGSLGKPRFVALTTWHGGPIAREAKALTPSACAWARGKGKMRIHYAAVLEAAVRCPDPLFAIRGSWLVRRLAPDCGRVELASLSRGRDDKRLLHAMGWETANVHLGSKGAADAIRADLKKRRRRPWLCGAAEAMLEQTIKSWRAWKDRSDLRVGGRVGRGVAGGE